MHIAIIMDGNGRFATAQGLPRLSGHQAGVEAAQRLLQELPALGVHTVTLYAFAIANWKRDKAEVEGLWTIFHAFIANGLPELIEAGTRLRIIGNREGLPTHVRKAVEDAETRSASNTKFLLQIALNYDGVDEVARMTRRAVASGVAADSIDATYVREHLDTEAGNEPDIVIRTGMETPQEGMGLWRASAFLPIQSAQSVCVSTDVLWPSFTIEHLKEIIAYANPDARLFGGQRR